MALGEVVEVEELRGRVVLGEAAPQPRHVGGREPRTPVGGDGDHRTQHGGRPSGVGEAPLLDEFLGRCELSGEDELDVGSQDGFLRERDRVVGERPVDHRRRDEHDVLRAGSRRPRRVMPR